jgi:hypothetical protein
MNFKKTIYSADPSERKPKDRMVESVVVNVAPLQVFVDLKLVFLPNGLLTFLQEAIPVRLSGRESGSPKHRWNVGLDDEDACEEGAQSRMSLAAEREEGLAAQTGSERKVLICLPK